MTVVILEAASPGLRGYLTRWMLEIRAGVFVGRVSARVRELLWARIEAKRGDAAAVMLASAPTEQGFKLWTGGSRSREIIDMDGLFLVRRLPRQPSDT